MGSVTSTGRLLTAPREVRIGKWHSARPRKTEVTRTRRVTLSDVAARAGVSKTTVSYILNDRSEEMRIAPDTEQRVRRVISELSYRPDRNARSLRTRKTATIGVITDYLASGMHAGRMLSGANLAAREAGHLLVIGETEDDPQSLDLLVEEMLDRHVDGIIYATRTALRLELPARLRGAHVVMLNCWQPGLDVPCILPDDRAGGTTAARLLVDAGIRERIHVVGESPEGEGVAGPQRLAGICEALAGADVDLAGQLECPWDPQPAYEAVTDLLSRGPVPQALICMNDRTAFGVYRALFEQGLRIPDDVSVVSFDGSALATWTNPPMTSVALPLTEMGRLAVELVLGEPASPDRARPGPRLIPMPVQRGGSVRSSEVCDHA